LAKSAHARGAGRTLYAVLFCLLLMGGGAVIAYMSAAETLDCSRAAGGRASCRLTRPLFGVPIVKELGFVQGAEVKTSTDTRRFGQARSPSAYLPVSWVVYYTDAGTVEGVQGESFTEPTQLVQGLTAYLATPSRPTFTAAITAGGKAHRFASWVFWGGATLLALSVLGWLFPALRPARRA
jgi:hypothetical protein